MADNNTFDAIKAHLQQTGDNEALKGLEEGAKLAQEQESTKEGVGQTFDIGMHDITNGIESPTNVLKQENNLATNKNRFSIEIGMLNDEPEFVFDQAFCVVYHSYTSALNQRIQLEQKYPHSTMLGEEYIYFQTHHFPEEYYETKFDKWDFDTNITCPKGIPAHPVYLNNDLIIENADNLINGMELSLTDMECLLTFLDSQKITNFSNTFRDNIERLNKTNGPSARLKNLANCLDILEPIAQNHNDRIQTHFKDMVDDKPEIVNGQKVFHSYASILNDRIKTEQEFPGSTMAGNEGVYFQKLYFPEDYLATQFDKWDHDISIPCPKGIPSHPVCLNNDLIIENADGLMNGMSLSIQDMECLLGMLNDHEILSVSNTIRTNIERISKLDGPNERLKNLENCLNILEPIAQASYDEFKQQNPDIIGPVDKSGLSNGADNDGM